MNRDKVMTLVGEKPGRTVTIMGGVHGNEPCGIKVIEELIEALKIDAGRVHLIYGNPLAIELGTRQTEMNLNRAFRFETLLSEKEKGAYERRRALEIMPYLRQSDALLDLHSSSSEKSIPFIICEPHSFALARQLPFPIRSWGWDAIEPGGTDYFVNRCGGYGLCVECGYHLDPLAPQRARETVKVFLNLMGLCVGSLAMSVSIPSQREIYAYGIYHTVNDFIPTRSFADFEPIQEGELVGMDGGIPVTAPKKGMVIFVKPQEGSLREAFILARETNVARETFSS